MPVRLGSIIIQMNRKQRECIKCGQCIQPGEVYNTRAGMKIVRTGKGEAKQVFSFPKFYHDYCWEEEYFQKKEEFLELHRKIENHESGTRKTKLSKLTPEQIRRRKTLQMYLIERDTPALIDAYERKSTQRVIRVMELIAERWEELHEMGVPFRTSLTSNKENENDKKLASYITRYETQWQAWLWGPAETVEDKLKALRRTEDEYPPDWSK